MLIEKYEKLKPLWYKGFRFDPEAQTFYTANLETFTPPKDYEVWNVECFDPSEYFNERMKELGIKEEDNKIQLLDTLGTRGATKADFKIFTWNDQGEIEILLYNLDRTTITKLPKGKTNKNHEVYCVQKRINPLFTSFCAGKYDAFELKNTPFWHPSLIEAFENEIEIEQLCVTEGQFKAWKATAEGIPTVGLTSISHFRDGETKELHTDIIKFIRKCNVKRVVVFWDADCKDISTKAIAQKKDLSLRPGNFFSFACSIQESIGKFFQGKERVYCYLATIRKQNRDKPPKGIDDLLIDKKTSSKKVLSDFQNIPTLPGTTIEYLPMNSDHDIKMLKSWFYLDSVSAFYNYHKEKIAGRAFVWRGNGYSIDLESKLPIIDVPKELEDYMMIGTSFYRNSLVPYPIGQKGDVDLERILEPWNKDRIVMDFGKNAPNRVVRYDGFVNIPSHLNYQQVIHGRWNLYYDVNHKPEKGEFPTIKTLLKHLFQDHFENELIYDWITILYRHPMQKLPVPALFSEDQGTGKSTFLNLLKMIFRQNMTVVSPKELTGDFNSGFVSKLLIGIEEALFEKKEGYEKLKAFTTQKYIQRNEKGKAQNDIACFMHFVILSNYKNFISIDKTDSRLWIRQVPPLEIQITEFDDKLESEINAFVDFIMHREIKHPKSSRFRFDTKLYQTSARDLVIEESRPGIVKDIELHLEELFAISGWHEIEMTATDIKKQFSLATGPRYIGNMIRQHFNTRIKTSGNGNEVPLNYAYPVPDITVVPERYRRVEGNGRAFVFYRSDFIKDDTDPQTVMDFNAKPLSNTQPTTYKFRAECENDILVLLEEIGHDEIMSYSIKPLSEGMPDKVCEITMKRFTLNDLKSEMKLITDGHIMVETLMPIDEYTGERISDDLPF